MDCNELARQFGGGGHKAAAGAFLEGPLDGVRRRVLDAVRAAMQ
jgi:phosphoesterase RecJ-like protein